PRRGEAGRQAQRRREDRRSDHRQGSAGSRPQIAENAGVDGSIVFEKIRSSRKVGYGYNAYDEVYCDMIASGIVDPTKVTRSALENAASIASCVLTTESLVTDKPDPAADAAAAAAAGGMGGGMY